MAHPTADLIILNGKVHCMDAANTRCEAVALGRGRILALGRREDILNISAPATRVIDARGRTVLPGFIDAHTHWSLLAKSMALQVDVRTPPVQSVQDLITAGRSAAGTTPKGEWILLQGNTFQAQQLVERRLPSLEELDRISLDHPILYRTTLHSLVLNSKALEVAGITEATVPPKGAAIGRDPATGKLTGWMAEMYSELPLPKASKDDLRRSVERTGRDLYLANGVSSIQEFWDSNEILRAQCQAVSSRTVPLRVSAYGWLPLAGSQEEILSKEVAGVHLEECWFEIAGIKYFSDGGTGGQTAAVYEPYHKQPDNFGKMMMESDELESRFRNAHEAGAQILIHAAGDRAQDECLAAFDRIFGNVRPQWERRHRLEHCGNVLWNAKRAAKCLELGISPVPNIGFLHVYGEYWKEIFGPKRSRPSVPLRTMLDQGFEIPGNADTTGGDLCLLNPIHNIWQAITRQSFHGNVLDAEEAITLDEGLRMYTRNAALAGRYLHNRGTLEIGKLGDVVIVSADMHALPVDELRHVNVDCTIVGGEIAYVRPEAEDSILG